MTLNDRERASVRSAIEKLDAYHLPRGTIDQVLITLRQIDTAPGRPADATGDSFETLIADMDDVIRGFPSTTTARFRDRLRDLVAAEMLNEEQNTPEVVSRDKVNDLPRGSRVVGSTEQGQAVAGGIVREVGVGVKLDLYHHYLVLDRAPQPPIKVGDEIEGKRAGELPRGSVVQRVYRRLTEYDPYPLIRVSGGWRMGPSDPVVDMTPDPDATFRVLAIGRS